MKDQLDTVLVTTRDHILVDHVDAMERIIAWRKALPKLGGPAPHMLVVAGEVGELFEAKGKDAVSDAIGDIAFATCSLFASIADLHSHRLTLLDIFESCGVLIDAPDAASLIVVAQGRLAETIRKQRSTKEQLQLAKTIFVGAQQKAQEEGLDFWYDCLHPVIKSNEQRLRDGYIVVDGTAIKKSDQPQMVGPRSMVTSPAHYKDAARVECITIIEDLGLGFNLGNALKYLWRAGRKDKAKVREDLEKSRFYIDREVALLGAPSWNPDSPPQLGNRQERV